MRTRYRPSEFDEARQERADDFRRFNANEAAIENAEAARKARLAANAEKIAKIERGES